MANIVKRTGKDGSIAYFVRVRLRGKTAFETFKRKTDAKHWAERTEAAILERRYFQTAESQRRTFREAIERYEQTQHFSTLKSAKTRHQHLAWWNERLGGLRLVDITPAIIVEHREELAAGKVPGGKLRGPATANRYRAAICALLELAVREWHWLDRNPCVQVSILKEPRGRVRYLLDEERERLLRECKAHSDELYLIVLLALATGARQGEILGLKWCDVDLKRGHVVFQETKNGERRGLPLRGQALELLRAKVRRIDTDMLFPSRQDPAKPIDVQNIFDNALQRAGIEDFRFHDLRHCCASNLAMNGASLAEIAAVLGHRTLEMVKRYSHLSDQHLGDVLTRMNER
ncbi:MAG: tyrosine-type recombinase/integrase, partial [Gammaproteobacteria bacterium]